jgi:integrase
MTTSAAQALTGRRESARLSLPSVRHFAELLALRCREDSWVRTAVASLDRFATLTGNDDLEALLAGARRDPRAGAAALEEFAAALAPATRPQIAALAMGPKLWFTLNGVNVPWRSLDGAEWAPAIMRAAFPVDRLILLALVGSGLHRSELLRLTIGDIGRLDAEGRLVPDVDADPLAVRYVQRRGHVEYITFFTDQARDVLRSELDRRRSAGETITAGSPLVAHVSGAPATAATTARARRFNASLIDAGNAVNVELCRKTGDFFRTWGAPGARFAAGPAAPATNREETV